MITVFSLAPAFCLVPPFLSSSPPPEISGKKDSLACQDPI